MGVSVRAISLQVPHRGQPLRPAVKTAGRDVVQLLNGERRYW